MAFMRKVKLALGLRSTPQSLGVIGGELGAFSEQGVDLAIVREETAGPDGIRGLLAGEYDFAEFGAVPVVQAALEGHDVLILMAAEPVSALYILARKGYCLAEGTCGRCDWRSLGGRPDRLFNDANARPLATACPRPPGRPRHLSQRFMERSRLALWRPAF